MLDRFQFNERDLATFIYEDLRIDLLNLCRQKVVYIEVVRDRLRDLGELLKMIDSDEMTDEQYERLCELSEKHG